MRGSGLPSTPTDSTPSTVKSQRMLVSMSRKRAVGSRASGKNYGEVGSCCTQDL